MAGLLTFAAAGATAGLGTGMVQEAKMLRDEKLRALDQQFRAGESEKQRTFTASQSDKDREFRAGESDETRAFTGEQNELNRSHQASQTDKQIGAMEPVRDAQADSLRANAEYTRAGRPGAGRASGGTEFERLASRLRDMEADDPMRPLVQERLEKLKGGMSDDAKRLAAGRAALNEVNQNDSLFGDKRDKALIEAQKKWMKFYGVGAPGEPGRPEATPGPETPRPGRNEQGSIGNEEPAKPLTQADFDALPSGAIYINPADGKKYKKK